MTESWATATLPKPKGKGLGWNEAVEVKAVD